MGLNDARGTLFYEFARVVKETKPKICIGENVRGLLNHNQGKTLQGMISVLDEIGYNVVDPRVLKAIHYNVPLSKRPEYPQRKKEIIELVPPGGYWRDLPLDLQKEYMQKSFYLGEGKTGIARSISWDEPCLTLTCSPAQKQTERCHPDETRPFKVREYARIQTFPDDWCFSGSLSQQYKQIGNAVPVNLAKELGYSIIKFLNKLNEQ